MKPHFDSVRGDPAQGRPASARKPRKKAGSSTWRKAALAVVGFPVAILASTAAAQNLPTARPESVGLSPERLTGITEKFQSGVDNGLIAGAVLLVSRHGKIAYHEAVGFRDREAGKPMPKDAIFRIYSMTKPIVSVAVMILSEEGRLRLSDPVSKYLPAFAGTKVGVESHDDATGQTKVTLVPAERESTILDLLRHTSGLTSDGSPGHTQIKKMYRAAGVDSRDQASAQFVETLGKLPLVAQPGTRWEYGHSTDVLGRLVEVLSGKTLGQFLEERIFRPLKMPDTAFYAPGDRLARVAEPLVDRATGKRPSLRDPSKPPSFESGGLGLLSTSSDYARFCQFMLNKGELDGVRLLSRDTVDLMTSNRLTSNAALTAASQLGPAYGFGLGFAVRTAAGSAQWPGPIGEYFWYGTAGTIFWIDPKKEMFAVCMAQMQAGTSTPMLRLFKIMVSQAIAD